MRRFPQLRIASLRLSWTVPSRSISASRDPDEAWTARDLWGYVQQDSAADAFVRAITVSAKDPAAAANGQVNGHSNGIGSTMPALRPWISGHEAFFIVAPEIAHKGNSKALKEKWWPNVPIKVGKAIEDMTGFFDCTKAREYLGWVHKDEWPESGE